MPASGIGMTQRERAVPEDHPRKEERSGPNRPDPSRFASIPHAPLLEDPPPNPAGGKTLIVDAADPGAYDRPSAAIKGAGPNDQIFIRPGCYEDKLFITERPILLVGAGRDHVQIFSRRGGPLYLQRVPGGRISGITFRYIGSDQKSAMNILDSSCTITGCRAEVLSRGV